MHPDLLKLQKYGFEIAPDKGMQIALSHHGPKAKVIKSPYRVPETRIHAVWNGDKVKMHYDITLVASSHTSSTSHTRVMQLKAFIEWVEGRRENYTNGFDFLMDNLPDTTEIVPYVMATTEEKLSTKNSGTWWQSAIHLLHTIIKNIWKQTAS